MKVLSVFSFMKGEEYGELIGRAMNQGLSMDEAIRIAYKEHGVIPLWKLYSHFTNPIFISAMGGVIGGTYHRKEVGFFNQHLLAALIKATKEMQ